MNSMTKTCCSTVPFNTCTKRWLLLFKCVNGPSETEALVVQGANWICLELKHGNVVTSKFLFLCVIKSKIDPCEWKSVHLLSYLILKGGLKK